MGVKSWQNRGRQDVQSHLPYVPRRSYVGYKISAHAESVLPLPSVAHALFPGRDRDPVWIAGVVSSRSGALARFAALGLHEKRCRPSGLECAPTPTRHFRAGLSHVAASRLGPRWLRATALPVSPLLLGVSPLHLHSSPAGLVRTFRILACFPFAVRCANFVKDVKRW
jgi:hypothetical protein